LTENFQGLITDNDAGGEVDNIGSDIIWHFGTDILSSGITPADGTDGIIVKEGNDEDKGGIKWALMLVLLV
jgi:hypothetical protein